MTAGDDSSDLSSLSSLSAPPSEDEIEVSTKKSTKEGILGYFPKLSELPPKEPSPPPRKRSPSPPHEYVLADNPDIAVRMLLALHRISFPFRIALHLSFANVLLFFFFRPGWNSRRWSAGNIWGGKVSLCCACWFRRDATFRVSTTGTRHWPREKC